MARQQQQTRQTAPATAPAATATQPAQGAVGNGGGAAAAGTALAVRGGVPAGALAPYDAKNFALLTLENSDASEMSEALAANLGENGQMSAFDFERVRVPAGGGLAWTVVDIATGEETAEKEIVGIVVGWSDQKAFWKVGLDEAAGEKKPPDCFSTDCVKGVGDPGVMCAQCPNNVFGSAKKGRGKACKDTRLLFICREQDVMPILLIVPPTSLKNVKKYFTTLTSRSIPYYRAVTRFKLSKDVNANRIEYSKVEPSLVGILPKEQFGTAKKFATQMKKMLGQSTVQVRPEDLRGGEDSVVDAPAAADNVDGSVVSGGAAGGGVAVGAGVAAGAGADAADDQTL